MSLLTATVLTLNRSLSDFRATSQRVAAARFDTQTERLFGSETRLHPTCWRKAGKSLSWSVTSVGPSFEPLRRVGLAKLQAEV